MNTHVSTAVTAGSATAAELEDLDIELLAELYEEAEAEIEATQRQSANAKSNARKDTVVAEFDSFLAKVFKLRGKNLSTCTPADVLTFITKVSGLESLPSQRAANLKMYRYTMLTTRFPRSVQDAAVCMAFCGQAFERAPSAPLPSPGK